MSSAGSSRRSSIGSILDGFSMPNSSNKKRKSRANSVEEGNTQHEETRGATLAELEIDTTLNPNVHYQFCQRDPMGNIILSILGELTMLANKSNKAMTTDIDDICEKFHNHSIAEKQRTKHRIMQTTANLERSMIEKELNSHAINQTIEAPSHFSPIDTWDNPRHTADCLRLLPAGSNKFNGARDGLSIVEYLHNLNQVQEQCHLSLDEFYKAMLASTTGAPYIYIMGAAKNNEDPANIYHNLLLRYDKRLHPEEARTRLYAYKIPKGTSLAQAESHIHELAEQATSSLPEGPARTIACNHEEVQALFRALPAQSSTLVRNQYSHLSARLGESATASDLSRLLNTYRHTIDQDIQAHGGDNRFNSGTRRFIRRSPTKPTGGGKRYTSYNITNTNPTPFVRPFINTVKPSLSTRPPYRPSFRGRGTGFRGPRSSNFRPLSGTFNQRRQNMPSNNFRNSANPTNWRGNSTPMTGQSRPSFTRRFTGRGNSSGNNSGNRDRVRKFGKRPGGNSNIRNRDYCSLCGKRDHKAVDGCPFMVNDAGKIVPIMPCKDTCQNCSSFVRTPLNHPSFICPFRKPNGPLCSK